MRVLILFAIAAAASAQGPGGRVSGIVVDAGSGEPLAGVDLSLAATPQVERSGETGSAFSARGGRTGLDGRFVFTDLPEDAYTLGLMKGGYEAGARAGVRFELTAAEKRRTLRVELRRSNAISGRVFDPDGDPVPRTIVQILEWSTSRGVRTLRQIRSERTDDRGYYRVHGLGPGRYIVGAQPSGLPSPAGVLAFEMTPAFYPSGALPETATVLSLDWGAEIEGVDLGLGWAAPTAIEGVIVDEDGSRGRSCRVLALEASSHRLVGDLRAAEDGLFAIRGLPPGRYWLKGASRRRGAESTVVAALAVAGRRTGATLELGVAVPVSGVVSIADADPGEFPSADMRIQLHSLFGGRLSRRGAARVDWNAGGMFTLGAVSPGHYRITPVGVPEGFYVSEILQYGRPLPSAKVTVLGEAAVGGLEVRLRQGAGKVSGRVALAGDRSAPPGLVALLPESYGEAGLDEWIASYGPDGSFHLTGVEPGKYLLFAAPIHNRLDLGSPADLDWLRDNARRIAVASGETVSADAPLLVGPR